MVYEFIATIAAAFGMAGMALLIRHLAQFVRIKIAKWFVPVFAAAGIFAFQIYQEYHWFDQTQIRLPQGVIVVWTIEQSIWYRPWSLIKPQPVQFVVLDSNSIKASDTYPKLKLVYLYSFERRMRVKVMPQIIDCQHNRRINASQFDANLSKMLSKNKEDWVMFSDKDKLLKKSVCL